MRLSVRIVAAAALLAAVVTVAPVRAEGPAGDSAEVSMRIGGRWTGAKLRCQKEENKLVRCGTPMPFEITFDDAGTGTTPDDNLPNEFSWRWLSPKEIGIVPQAGGKEIKLFAVEHEEETILTFQAYVYLPATDPNAPVEVRYIHYVFDVSRAE